MKVTARQEIGCPSEPLIDSSRMCHNRCSGCQQTLQRDGCFSGIASASGTFLYRQPLERSGAVINLSFSYPLLKSFYFIIYNFSIGIFLKSYGYLSFQSFTDHTCLWNLHLHLVLTSNSSSFSFFHHNSIFSFHYSLSYQLGHLLVCKCYLLLV